jgi:hypothetical protein
MFGHQDDQAHQDNNHITAVTPPAVNGAPAQPADNSAWQHPDTLPSTNIPPVAGSDTHVPAPPTTFNTDHHSASDNGDDGLTSPPAATTSSFFSAGAKSDEADSDDNDSTDLLRLKQQALGQLSPLVGQLDQSPEEQFRTLMMMIQASDDQSLIKSAYDTAQKIDDEKARARALLDIINEINYFTQPKHDQAE